MILSTLLERFLHRLHLLPTPVLDVFGNVLFGRLLAVAVRRGVFETVAHNALPIEDIASKTGMDVHAASLLCEALAVSGYFRKSGARFSASPEAQRWLLRNSPQSLYHLITYFETLHHRWQSIEYSLDHGHPERPYFEAFGPADWETYVLAMRDLARLLLPRVMKRLRLPADGGSLLDIGASHGLYTLACCKRAPSLKATMMDFAPALAHATKSVDAEGMQSRIRFVPGDFTKAALPGKQDVVLMFNIIHGFDAETNRRLVRQALDALTDSGRLYILDQFATRHRGSSLAKFIPLMVGANLLNEVGGTVHSVNDVRDWCGKHAVVHVRNLGIPGVGLAEVSSRA